MARRTVAFALPTPDLESLSPPSPTARTPAATPTQGAPLGAQRGTGIRAKAAGNGNGNGPRVMVVSGAGQGKAAKDAVARAAVLGDGP